MNDLRELSKRVHGLLRLGGGLPGRVGARGLIHGADPREELGQSRHAVVSTLQPLPVVPQAEQGPVSMGDVDAVAVREDLLPEGAVVSAVGALQAMGHVHIKRCTGCELDEQDTWL